MRSRTFHLLNSAFSIAIVACREKTALVPPPTPTSSLASQSSQTSRMSQASSASDASAQVPDSPPPASAVTIAPTESRPGQRCLGSLVAALHPGVAVDYLELRLDYYPQREHEVVTAGQSGKPCASAKDAAACTKALAAAHSASGGEYLVYTRGDEVGTVTGRAAGLFLAPIDSPEEAAMALVYALSDGHSTAEVFPPCDPPTFSKIKDGFQTVYSQASFCDEKTVSTYAIGRDGTASTVNTTHTPPKPGCHPPFLGRKPEGYLLGARKDHATIGGFFAECTEMEAASVCSFRRLETELRALAAPKALRRRARRSSRDEARHARAMRALAKRFGEAPRPLRIAPLEARDATELAIENAVEGCVFETWAALLATWQAERAKDPEIREKMRLIARDETRHAALAWDVAAWAATRLSPGENVRVLAARAAAVAALRNSLSDEPTRELRELAGLPSAAEAQLLFKAASRQLRRAHVGGFGGIST